LRTTSELADIGEVARVLVNTEAFKAAMRTPYFFEALEGCFPVHDPDQSRFRRAQAIIRSLAAFKG
jgi:hypothetical protein